ncbi:MAG: Fe-S cluster assembly ATPase SufC [Inconstantimicrobium porci]|uniref:Fe-S cluster assembly ATPase SufC n=1 Tax=Inconstantimicrobium porci TaxID=2652291 RepID=A0A7X2MYC9_9CLOT|nr:Fe-S cluster assembly ATPase SufC [Inconstantimicrobium porci]MDD6771531.1 Fe-S cluster assembly ATPase SufC [Inconstantimicrobium porci]MDY5910954.1 Fe-S cluster assembly ATPase SufC [Inconstantimicrobium porci]MSR90890.1 Fe-S cluster assembly ATPase SufC [Inconstantimicrobium porci]
MENNILNIVNLNTEVEGKDILKGFNLKINKGEVHVIMGPNGAGKSTLANTLMANSRYTVKSGDIEFEGENINNLKTHERAKKGLFLSFQHPEEVSGITVENFLKTVKSSEATGMMGFMKFSADLNKYMDELKMDKSYAKRYLNVGFSGGEKKKNEILQMLMINPKLAILDETDSGLDVDAIRVVSKGINMFLKDDNAVLIITHNTKILENLKPDYIHVLIDGRIVKTGDYSLAKEIEENGYESFKKLL